MTGENKSHRLNDILAEVVTKIGDSKRKKIVLPMKGLSKHLVGLLEGELWILGGYTSSGKSFMALQFALEAATQGFSVGFYSLEMSREALALRIWASLCNITPMRLEFGRVLPEELERKKVSKDYLKDLNFYIHDDLYSIDKILESSKVYDLVIIDFIQNLLPGRREDEYHKLSNAIVKIQKSAKANKNTYLVCSQLSNLEAREGTSSKIIGYKGSGGLAAACDVGLLLEKKVDYNAKESERESYTLYCRKNRRGSLFKIPLEFKFPNGMFKEKYG